MQNSYASNGKLINITRGFAVITNAYIYTQLDYLVCYNALLCIKVSTNLICSY